MTLDDFVKKWDGKQCEVAGSVGAENQCVDLANAYIRDVLKLPIIEWTHAKDFWTVAGNQYDKIKNTPSAVPEKGDVIIWYNSPYGHIAICLEADKNKFKSFDQNWSLKQRCKIEGHYYNNVVGWLHPKGGNMEYKGLDLKNEESMKVAVDIFDDVVNQKLYVKKDKYDKLSQDYNKLKDSTEARIKAETDNREELSNMLAVENDWPKILENVGELLAAKENKKVEVVETGHSKICRMLAKVGL